MPIVAIKALDSPDVLGEKPELYIDKRDIINAKVIVKNNINKWSFIILKW